MKLLTFKKENEIRTGVLTLDESKVIDLKEGLQWLRAEGKSPAQLDPDAGKEMIRLIENQDSSLPAIESIQLAQKEGRLPQEFLRDEKELTLLSPIPRPVSCRDGYAFRQHVETARRNRGVPMIPEFDQFPVFYFTNHLAITGPGELFIQPKAMERLDFELEVGMVVGKKGRNLTAQNADEHIFGFTIMNDWSARAMQMQEMKMSLGPAKGKDFATSLGPYLVPRASLHSRKNPTPNGEQHDLRMKAFVNQKQLSDGNLKDMSWTFAQILERVSYGVDVHPGEVIGSGTVGTGCFLELNGSKITDNQWLQPGDEVILEVEELGSLRNVIRAAEA